jgi:protease-4
MNNFFKTFFAALLALVVFTILFFLFFIGFSASLVSQPAAVVNNNSVLVVDLEKNYPEVNSIDPFTSAFNLGSIEAPTLYDLTEAIRDAARNDKIKGIYLKSGLSPIGLAAGDDIRQALLEFKESGKFIYAYGEMLNQPAYHIMNVADKIYCNPMGGLDWSGISMNLIFLKDALDRLEIKPQIFYAGKFKSATEPFRERKMTDANRIQNQELVDDLYSNFLEKASETRDLDVATLKSLAVEGKINFASDALNYKLIDGIRYDDEVKEEIGNLLGVAKITNIDFISVKKYLQAAKRTSAGKDQIAVIFAEGDIVDGNADRGSIGSGNYIRMIREARFSSRVKAIVFRINSGGGSAMASENILRELALAKKEKPVILSFGEVAASGGYYLSVVADSIFLQPNTITGSIGVFSLIPNFQDFMNKKLGVTFDEVYSATPPLTSTKPLTPLQREQMQSMVDSIYITFKSRVAEGRRLDMDYVDSIAQGRIWSGTQAVKLGLADRIGSLKDAIDAAAKLAGLETYYVRKYPEPLKLMDLFFSDSDDNDIQIKVLEKKIPAEFSSLLKYYQEIKTYSEGPQARLPFRFTIK